MQALTVMRIGRAAGFIRGCVVVCRVVSHARPSWLPTLVGSPSLKSNSVIVCNGIKDDRKSVVAS